MHPIHDIAPKSPPLARRRRAGVGREGGTRTCLTLSLLLVFVMAALPVHASDDTIDYLELATILVRDGAHDRADAALAQVDPDDPAVDTVRYHSVRGLLAVGRQELARAADAFAVAIAAARKQADAENGRPVDPLLHLHHAQALFGLERFDEAIAALDAAGAAVEAISGAWLMRAHAQWQLGHHQAALDVLAAGAQRFPDNPEFRRRQVFYLVELGLYQEAARLGLAQLDAGAADAMELAAIGTALRRAGSFEAALAVLERGSLRFPGNGAIARALAQAWLESGKPLAAAEVLARQAEGEPVLLPETAELFRRAGHPLRALALNARIGEQPRKLEQRVGLLLELGRFAEVVAMEEALYRAGLLADEDIRYALAYAHFHAADHAATERHLKALTRPDLFRRATELRRVMQDCADRRWMCG